MMIQLKLRSSSGIEREQRPLCKEQEHPAWRRKYTGVVGVQSILNDLSTISNIYYSRVECTNSVLPVVMYCWV